VQCAAEVRLYTVGPALSNVRSCLLLVLRILIISLCREFNYGHFETGTQGWCKAMCTAMRICLTLLKVGVCTGPCVEHVRPSYILTTICSSSPPFVSLAFVHLECSLQHHPLLMSCLTRRAYTFQVELSRTITTVMDWLLGKVRCFLTSTAIKLTFGQFVSWI